MRSFFLVLFAIVGLSSAYSLCAVNSNSACLPCPSQCAACSVSTSCSSCDNDYFSLVSATTGCEQCSANCLSCSSSTACSVCNNPYVLDSNSSCALCTVSNALSCSTTSTASSCKAGYYLSDGSCKSCLLNCVSCTSAFDCSACGTGYYLNSSILTCNPCPAGCSSCNQFAPTQCTACSDNYQLSGTSCNAITCSLANCQVCSDASTCKRCQLFYYWNGTQCVNGGSISCQYGASGSLPNNCINQCGDYSRVADNYSSTFRCQLRSHLYLSSVEYRQVYYYAYNSLNDLNQLASTSATLATESNNQMSFPLASSLSFGSLPSYYQVIVTLKYSAASSVTVTLSATTPANSTQTETHSLAASSSPVGAQLTASVVHSNNLQVSVSSSVSLVEIWLRMAKCSSGCIVCLNQQLCEYCDNNFYMLGYACYANCTNYLHFQPNRTCLTSCPDGYQQTTANNSLKYCTACTSPCATCLNSTHCLSCISGYFYYEYSCPTSCPDQFYADNSTNKCESCVTPCRTCTDSQTCLSCQLGFWNGTVCSTNCPDGTYGNSNSQACQSCDSTCLTCSNSASECTSCSNSLILHSGSCLASCPDRYYGLNSTCYECVPPCYTCSSSSQCLSCSYNFFHNSSCISTCPDGYYPDQANLVCSACPSSCLTCSSSVLCTTCNPSDCLYQGQCLSSCPSQSFFALTNATTNQCACTQCIYPCSTCLNASACLSCIDGFYHENSCLTQCPSSYYANSENSTCSLCSSLFTNCLVCSSSACTQCDSSFFLSSGACVSSCPDSFYPQNQQCLLCQSPCQTCTSTYACLSCVTPYVLLNSQCVISCPTTMTSLTVNSTLQCIDCQAPCLSCSVTVTNCTYCQFGYFLYNNECITNCSTASSTQFSLFGQISTLSCQNCAFPCATCLSQNQCLSCQIGYLNPTAYTCNQCDIGTYADGQVCTSCPSECSICFSATFCTSCNSGYFLYNNQCINDSSVCQLNGHYVSGSVCYACIQPCLRCSGSATNCTSCLTGYIFSSPNQCLISCPSGYYQSSSSCLACSAQCATCITASNFCLTCATNYSLYLTNSSCLTSCPNITYLSGSLCTNCRYPCQTCSSQSACTSCLSGVLVGTSCYSSCLNGYFADANMTCQQCTSPCSECNVVSTNCTQCITNYWLYQSTCVVSCPANHFSESQSGNCLACAGFCEECTSYVNCTSCVSPYIYLFSTTSNVGQCLSGCPAGYYLNNGGCSACDSACSSCQNGNACLLCSGGLVQYVGGCVSECQGGMYSLSGVCQNCSFPCQNCTGASTCTSCPTDYLLVGSSSCVPGPNCPSGYYLHPTEPSCSTSCPSGYYNLPNQTCSNTSCGDQWFMGSDMQCYLTCPAGQQANSSLHCSDCGACQGGLYFQLTTAIIKDSLYLYLIFTEAPQYSNSPTLTFSPALPYRNINEGSLNLVGSSSLNMTGSTNITFIIELNYSIQETGLNLSFGNPLATFSNPLQRSYSTTTIEGYDYYPTDLPDMSSLAYLALLCSLVGLVKNPYMVDLGQVLFLLGLLDAHYPYHLASFLEGSSIAHLHGMVKIEQKNSEGEGKFMYITGTGLLSNTLTNWLIIAIFSFISLILFIIKVIASRKTYAKVDDESRHSKSVSAKGGESQSAGQQKEELPKIPCRVRVVQLMEWFLDEYKHRWLSRVLYFNYSIISLFALLQIANFNTTDGINAISSALAVITVPLLLFIPFTYRNEKPKYTFLYIRKLLISAAVVLSLQDPVYAIGIVSVCNLTAALLLLSYKLEVYRIETRLVAGGQILQCIVFTTLSFLLMIGEGNQTDAKVTLAWAILYILIAVLTVYIAHAIMELVIHICNKARDTEVRSKWALNRAEDQTTDSHHSQSVDPSLKQPSEKGDKPDVIEQIEKQDNNMEGLLEQMKSEIKMKSQMRNRRGDNNRVRSSEHRMRQDSVNRGDQQFWAYESEKDSNSETGAEGEKALPEMLVRCVNEFSEYGGGESRQK